MADSATKIKFCGITNARDAELAIAAGAWAIGLIFWPNSRRRCPPERAAEIAAAFKRRVEVVGVFVNPTIEYVAQVAENVELTMLQLHGEEGPAFCAEAGRRTGCKVIKAARVRSGADIQALSPYRTDYHLLDSHSKGMPGGTGETFSWELARAHGREVPMILSGGLTPANVADAIGVVDPFAVDVATGVESAPGQKDPAKLEAFADAVARAQPDDSSAAQSSEAGGRAGRKLEPEPPAPHAAPDGRAHARAHGDVHARPRTRTP